MTSEKLISKEKKSKFANNRAIKKVNNGVFDKDIEEYEQDGAALEDLSDFVQKAA